VGDDLRLSQRLVAAVAVVEYHLPQPVVVVEEEAPRQPRRALMASCRSCARAHSNEDLAMAPQLVKEVAWRDQHEESLSL